MEVTGGLRARTWRSQDWSRRILMMSWFLLIMRCIPQGFHRLDSLPCVSSGAVEMHWIDTYFPFSNPSFELEIYFQEKWLEVLGCGVTEQEILKRSGKTNNVAWAFGLGLERLAMVLFDIPDIRLFWSNGERFTSQFSKGHLGVKFKPFSKYPPCYKDISFWINESFTENNLCEVVRGIAGDLAEEVLLIDNFTNKKGMTSHCYRIAYRSMEHSLTDDEINELQWNVRQQVQQVECCSSMRVSGAVRYLFHFKVSKDREKHPQD
ncbi:phenylalanine--tRNA ligase, chloroplastic/mitochondrial-like [Quercus robur]|uniref:phenylalanine--tRNA ligase, chloroplastic/mitochondrial-like n=1 Tax=Quercus robur TaxID=38942 RepID=UPI00216332A0|nr:phenylalanine--tRNA ligase, chloroplastic/mitochondrial-like [Quercus robur]